jgi:tetratricopeptide (TPR) repeat protein
MAYEQQALAIFRHAYPPGHWSIGFTLNYIGNILDDAADRSVLTAVAGSSDDLERTEALYRELLLGPPARTSGEPTPVHRAAARNLAKLAGIYLRLGRELVNAGKTLDAEDSTRKGLSLLTERLSCKNETPALLGDTALGLIEPLVLADRSDQATVVGSELLSLNPTNGFQLYELAWRLAVTPDLHAHDPKLAVALAKRSCELAPQFPNRWDALGIAHFRAGDLEAAIHDLEKSLQVGDGGNPFTFIFLAMAQQRQGHFDIAREWYAKAVQRMQQRNSGNPKLNRFRAEAEALLGIQPTTVPTAAAPAP